MATITYRTTDEKRNKLADLANEQAISVNKVIDELVTIALTERDAYRRFTARANKGNPSQALDILRSKSID
ncbi:MAG: hypothetical protein KAI17_07485 [Thiotrichaceae bacterium]|nr:hypothetical protein [Thiotrichaceae bacterium]